MDRDATGDYRLVRATAQVNGIRLHYVLEGQGPLVVLLHGWPQTWYCWRKVIAPLADGHTVLVPDLRGYGQSDKPPAGYDKRTMAEDVRALAGHLGHSRIALLAGHDRGARVAHRYALDHPGEVERLAVLDIVPTREMFARADATVARGYWHWLFHLQPDLPELLVGPNIEAYLRWFFERWTANRPAVEEAVPEYVHAFSAPGALRAGFDDYRATSPTTSTPTRPAPEPASAWPSSAPDPLSWAVMTPLRRLWRAASPLSGRRLVARAARQHQGAYPALKATPPNWSKASATPGTPGLFWVNSWPPVAVSPPAEPGITLTAPAPCALPTASSGAPAARSSKPSLLKSPAANEEPN